MSKLQEATNRLVEAVRKGQFGPTRDIEREVKKHGYEDAHDWLDTALSAYDSVRSETTLADKCFDASNEMGDRVEEVFDIIERFWPGREFDDVSWDYYDASVEVHNVENDATLSSSNLEELWKTGFKKCYLNHADKSESLYVAPSLTRIGYKDAPV